MDTNETSEKQSGWLLPERRKSAVLPAGLYLVATPIGNLGDMSVRALDILATADVVLCEDTRVTGKLLKAFDLSRAMKVYNDHSRAGERDAIVDSIAAGKRVALVSDAGTPLVSDPGYKLVQACRAAGAMVTSVPGANAVLTALQLSGLPSDAFSFIGFLPSKSKARQDVLMRWRDVQASLVAYETAPRLVKALADIADVMGADRRVAVVREMTKLYEEAVMDSAADLLARYERDGLPKGEIVLVIEPPVRVVASKDDVKGQLAVLLGEMSVKEASALVAEQTGWAKKEIYALALEVKNMSRRSEAEVDGG